MAFKEDGIVEEIGQELKLSETGKIFVRNVAMCFDFHLREQTSTTKFSQTI